MNTMMHLSEDLFFLVDIQANISWQTRARVCHTELSAAYLQDVSLTFQIVDKDTFPVENERKNSEKANFALISSTLRFGMGREKRVF